jgi:hypothetical protein
MNMRTLMAGAALGALVLLSAGCSDKPAVYKQGQYQGKPDSAPWNNATFKDSQAEWEKAIKARNQGQDEYARTVSSAN